MPFRCVIKGVQIEVDTAEELSAIIAMSSENELPLPRNGDDIQKRGRDNSLPTEPNDVNLKPLLKQLQGTAAANILLFIASQENNIASDADLKAHLGLADDGNLGPKLSNLSKELKRAGIEKDAVFLSQYFI